jgi:hypothetical protein
MRHRKKRKTTARVRQTVAGRPNRRRSKSRKWKRWNLLNDLISKNKYASYLEIGVATLNNFDKIKCRTKVGVDPAKRGRKRPTHLMTSDRFFRECKRTFDLVFIDGLHHCEQVEKDILNSLDVLNTGGTIVCHDMNPYKLQHQLRTRSSASSIWNGDCWKAWVKLRRTRSDLWMAVVRMDHGCGIIQRGNQKLLTDNDPLTWENLQKNRVHWLNLISVEQYRGNKDIGDMNIGFL